MSTSAAATRITKAYYGEDMDIDFNISLDAYDDNGEWELDLSLPTAAQGLSGVAERGAGGDDEYDNSYAEDVNLIYMNTLFPCDTAVLRRGSDVFRELLEGYTPDGAKPSSFSVTRYIECDCPEVFFAVLETMYSGDWTREQAWEQTLSYFSCVKLWLMGHHWGIAACKAIAADRMAAVTAAVMGETPGGDTPGGAPTGDSDPPPPYSLHATSSAPSSRRGRQQQQQQRQQQPTATATMAIPSAPGPHPSQPPRLTAATRGAHLASLVRALRLADRHPWHSRLWKLLYDAGDRLAPRLRHAPVFTDYVRDRRAGADFARAIGLRGM